MLRNRLRAASYEAIVTSTTLNAFSRRVCWRPALTLSRTISTKTMDHAMESTTQDSSSPNKWSSPGPAAFDFRSDVVTTPTTAMLNAIANTTLLDDVFVEDPTTNSLETFIANLSGHSAALLVLSGTMGNQLALRTHLAAPPHAVLTDSRSHILGWEAGGVASLSGALVQAVSPKNGHHLTLEDVKEHAVLDDDVHACPTRVISLENTLAGTVIPLEECRRISEWAWSQKPQITMHLDGARLWEAVVSGAGSLKDYCACFDSTSLCFSKGLGAPIGSMITGTEAFTKRARWVRKSIGGGLRQAGVIAAPARIAVEETFLGGALKQSHEKATRIAQMWTDMGGTLAQPTETNMVWLDLSTAGISRDEFIALATQHGIRAMGGRLVVHYQIGEEAIKNLQVLMKAMMIYEGSAKNTDRTLGEASRVTV